MDKLQLGELTRRALTSTRALSPAGVAIWMPLGVLRALYRQSLIDPNPSKIVIALLVVAGSCLIASWLVRFTVLRGRTDRAGTGRTFAAYLLVVVIVGVLQQIAARLSGTEIGFSPVRLVTALLVLYLVACVLDYFDRYRDAIVQLRKEQQGLILLRTSHAERLFAMRTAIVDATWQQVAPAWARITDRLAGLADHESAQALHSVAASIRADLIDPIRALSYQVQDVEVAVSPDKAAAAEVSQRWLLNWREVLLGVPIAHPFPAVVVGLSLLVYSMNNFDYFDLLTLVVSSLSMVITIMVLLFAAQKLVLPLIRRAAAPVGWFVYVLTITVISAVTAVVFAAFLLRANSVVDLRAVLLGELLLMTIIFIWSVLASVVSKAASTEAQLRRTIELTRQETLALEREVALTRQRIAQALHGEVQTLLTSAAFRLDLAAERITDNVNIFGSQQLASVIDDARATVTDAAARIDAIALESNLRSADAVESGLGVAEHIRNLRDAWDGIAKITSSINGETAQRLDARVNDASLAPVVVDLVREAILNAVRHAHAAHIQISIHAVNSACEITVINDGLRLPGDLTPGLGQNMLDKLGCRWTISPGATSGALLRIELPLLINATA